MDRMKDIISRGWLLPALALVVGIGLGILYGWVINPVEWVNGTPAQLREDVRVDFAREAVVPAGTGGAPMG